ncbi:MAG: PilZ domain-containing protein [Pseudomonadales bacterium]|nr:PilZ domain-containing protein [Pseudomonadales bacterium]
MSNDDLSIDQRASLLRLYLDWPVHIDQGLDQEANEFYFWLSEQMDKPELAEISGGLDGIKAFLGINPDVLSRARYLKGKAGNTDPRADLREGSRVPVNTQVFFLVYDCTEEPAMEGSLIHGHIVDIGRQGVRAETVQSVPAHSILSMTVAQLGSGVITYNLTGQVRWSAAHAESKHLGISIFNIEDFNKWQSFYYSLTMGD